MRVLAALLVAFMLAGCSDGAADKLRERGYTNVQIEGQAFIEGWLCGKSMRYHFTATNPKGEKVKGVVCYPNILVDVAKENPA